MVTEGPRAGGSGTRLGDLSEEALLSRIVGAFAPHPWLLVGPGDDAAVLATGPSTVVTTDSMTRGRDWLDHWSDAGDVAVKLLAQNLSDLAAMGARPRSLVVSLLADPNTPAAWAVDFSAALGQAAEAADVAVAGGDLSSAGGGVVVVSMTAMGDLEGRSPVLRSGARAGDVVALAGSLGWSAAGLWLLQQGEQGLTDEARAMVDHHRRPTARVAAGTAAAQAGATAMIDLSDGLLRDATRLARASAVALDLDPSALAERAARLESCIGEQGSECVLSGGEEYSLLATFPAGADLPAGFRELGRVVQGEGVSIGGEPQEPRGWDHFGG